MSVLIPILIKESGLAESDLQSILENAPSRYKVYPIPKRTGGQRIIAQPARELKVLQRALVEHILDRLPVHNAATAYQTGTSIKVNAERHVHNGPILKYDFKDFFPSLRSRDWQSYCNQHSLFDFDEDLEISTRILFRKPERSSVLRLAIGAPSSPLLSNILMYEFDDQVTKAVARDKVTYTRYADDLTFSARRTGYLNGVDKALRRIIGELKSPRLSINEGKTVVATKKFRRVVTGLVLSNDGSVSLGRDRKRLIRATLHHAKAGSLDRSELVRLSGILAFAQDIEPNFIENMKRLYGAETIEIVRKIKI